MVADGRNKTERGMTFRVSQVKSFDHRASSTHLSWQRIYPEFFCSIVTLSVRCKPFRSYKNSYVKEIPKWSLRAVFIVLGKQLRSPTNRITFSLTKILAHPVGNLSHFLCVPHVSLSLAQKILHAKPQHERSEKPYTDKTKSTCNEHA